MGPVLCLLMGESTQRCDVPLTPVARVQAGATLAAAAVPFLTLESSSTVSVSCLYRLSLSALLSIEVFEQLLK